MTEKKSLRLAYGETLVELGRVEKKLVVLEADLGKSTKGQMFKEPYPDRFLEMNIAESNMASVAAGLSLTGKIPFFASFAVFATGRCYDQIRTSICIPNLNVKICGSSAGLSDYGDGSTHQSIEDIAIMRVLPNMQVFSPCDSIQTAKIVRYMCKNKGPMYLRINRNDLPVVTEENEEFVPGKIYIRREGSEAAIFATGVMVSIALNSADKLQKEGISVMVVDVPSIKPLDSRAIVDICSSVKSVITAEEHSVIGGLGSLISEKIADKIEKKVHYIGIRDTFGKSAQSYSILLENFGLTEENIIKTVKEALA